MKLLRCWNGEAGPRARSRRGGKDANFRVSRAPVSSAPQEAPLQNRDVLAIDTRLCGTAVPEIEKPQTGYLGAAQPEERGHPRDVRDVDEPVRRNIVPNWRRWNRLAKVVRQKGDVGDV
jgi:hypothetical protein